MEIYLITDLTNSKQYVGQTVYTKDERWRGHLYGDLYIDRAIRKHKPENFEVKTLEVVNQAELLNEREKYWIQELNTLIPNGYNILPGGNCHAGVSVTDDIEKMFYKMYYPLSNLNKNKRIKMYIFRQDSLSDLMDKNGIYNLIDSSPDAWVEWHRDSYSFIGKYIDENDIKSIASEIRFYPSINFLCANPPEQCFNFLKSSHILKSLQTNKFVPFDDYDNYIMSDYLAYITYDVDETEYDQYVKCVIQEKVKWYNENPEELDHFLKTEKRIKLLRHQAAIKRSIEKNRSKNNITNHYVKQYTQDGYFIIEYLSASDASQATGINKSCILGCCKERSVTSGGFLWCESGNEKIIQKKIEILQDRQNARTQNKTKYKSQYKNKKKRAMKRNNKSKRGKAIGPSYT